MMVRKKRYVVSGSLVAALLYILCVHLSLNAQSWYEKLNLPKASSWQAITLFVGIALFIGIVLLVEMQRKIKASIQGKKNALVHFHDNAQRFNLLPEEKRRLQVLAHYLDAEKRNEIFDSIAVFEQCLHKDIQHLLSTAVSEMERRDDEALLFAIRKKLKYSHPDFLPVLYSTRNISMGQSLSIFEKNGKIPLIQKAKVTTNQEYGFHVEYSITTETPLVVANNTPLRLCFARTNDGIYDIDATVHASSANGWIEFFHTLDLKRNQIRKDVRIEVALPMKFRVLKTADAAETGSVKSTLFGARIADLSGGGLSFVADISRKPGDIITINFQLPDTMLSGIQGKILRVGAQKGKPDTAYKHHVQFINMEQGHKEKIVRFIFEKMRLNNQWH